MGRLAVVTGANRGLGFAIVRELSENGWDVLALTRTSAEPAGGSWPAGVVPVLHDVRSEPSHALTAAVGQRPVDLLVNNAAQGAPHARLGAIEPAGLMNAVDANVAGPLRLTQFLLPNLLAAPDPVIVNVASRLGSVAAQAKGDFADLSTSYAYKVSKAAQNMLTVSLAQELQGQVRCWAVHPGKLATAMGQSDASKSPATAARQLRELVDSGSRTSPRFCSLGEEDLAW